MKDERINNETTEKNPNFVNGEVTILSPQLPPQGEDSDNTETTENQVVDTKKPHNKSVYIESYGCQMNFSDSEVVASILAKEGYQTTPKMETADLILVNTCSIREKVLMT